MWMAVTDADGCEWVLNIDEIVRFSKGPLGAFVELSTGSRLHLADTYDSIKQTVLQADAKRAK